MYTFSRHQANQVVVINDIEEQVRNSALQFSTVAPVEDYENDPRICLTSVHIPHEYLITKIQEELIRPLRIIAPHHFYYSPDSLHMTIKGVRVVSHPPNFTDEDIEKAKKVFAETVAYHRAFHVYFYRLLLFPHNLALVGTTDEELDNIILALDEKLKAAGVPDDKVYANKAYFFSNMTLARFREPPSKALEQTIAELSRSITFDPYCVDSVTLLTCNAVFQRRHIIETWKLPTKVSHRAT
jgi:hypothetical protein